MEILLHIHVYEQRYMYIRLVPVTPKRYLPGPCPDQSIYTAGPQWRGSGGGWASAPLAGGWGGLLCDLRTASLGHL